MTAPAPQAGGWVERAGRLAEDFADDCVRAGYVTTSAKSRDILLAHLTAQAALTERLIEVATMTVRRFDEDCLLSFRELRELLEEYDAHQKGTA